MDKSLVHRYELGLSLSGAKSAGAYTAGVLDFLFQALDECEAATSNGDPNVPVNMVGLKVMAGASAGAIRRFVSFSHALADSWCSRVSMVPAIA